MARYEGDTLKLKNFNADLFLEEASERMTITHSIVTTTSKEGVKFLVNKQVLALSAILNIWLPRSNYLVSRLVVFGRINSSGLTTNTEYVFLVPFQLNQYWDETFGSSS